jgi:hypothetical protein
MAELKKDRKRLWRYGITHEQYLELLESQGGVCAICGVSALEKKFDVDHDPACCPSNSSNKTCGSCIRGLLCRRCNLGLGFVENREFVLKAMEYLGEN